MTISNAIVTVVLPTYNRREYLPTAIRSIVGQSFPDWRLLVVNDGGEDVSDIVAAFGDSRIECLDCPHRGKAAALNDGLGLVLSPYVAYMDDDDAVYPDHLAKLVDLAERSGAEFVYSDTWAVLIDANGKEIRRYVENEDDVSFDDIRFFNRINHKQILHTKRLADEVGKYDEKLRILIDYDYIRRLAQHAKPVHLHAITGEHYLRQASDSANDFASITGLWVSDPEACGTSIATIFGKDPAALADLYRDAHRDRGRVKTLEAQLTATRAELHKTQTDLLHTKGELAQTRDALGRELGEVRKVAQAVSSRLQVVEKSLSYKVGRVLTAPFRVLFEAIHMMMRFGR